MSGLTNHTSDKTGGDGKTAFSSSFSGSGLFFPQNIFLSDSSGSGNIALRTSNPGDVIIVDGVVSPDKNQTPAALICDKDFEIDMISGNLSLTSTNNINITTNKKTKNDYGNINLSSGNLNINARTIQISNKESSLYTLPTVHPLLNQIMVADEYGNLIFTDPSVGLVTNPMQQELQGNLNAISNISSLSFHNDISSTSPVSLTVNEGMLNISNSISINATNFITSKFNVNDTLENIRTLLFNLTGLTV